MKEDYGEKNRVASLMKLKMHGKSALPVVGEEEKKIMPWILKH